VEAEGEAEEADTSRCVRVSVLYDTKSDREGEILILIIERDSNGQGENKGNFKGARAETRSDVRENTIGIIRLY
jgi:hypothetical protein